MKKITTILLAVAVTTLYAFTGKLPHTVNFKLNPKASTVEWTGEKVTGKHSGTIMFSDGNLSNDHGRWSGMFEMDMTTITNTDLKSGEGKEKLEGHLKGPDFFDVKKYPKARFVVTSITPLDAQNENATHNVKGNMTIKDKTNPESFNVKMKAEGNAIMFTGSAIIDRTKYDVRYGSKSFFEDIGDKAISDQFTLKFNVTLTN